MEPIKSTVTYEAFFNNADCQRYNSIKDEDQTKPLFDFLKARTCCLVSSIENHNAPALQGVYNDLDKFLRKFYEWSKKSEKNSLVAQMIGSMVKHLVGEFGYEVDQYSVRLKGNGLMTTAATYKKKASH